MNNHLDPTWLHHQFVTLNRTCQDIASECGVTRAAIHLHVKKHGLMAKKRALHALYSDENWLHNQIVTLRKHHKQIASEQNVSPDTISNWACKYGIRRPPFTPQERNRRNVEWHKRLYHNDPAWRERIKANATRWRQENKERYNAYQREYARKKRAAAKT